MTLFSIQEPPRQGLQPSLQALLALGFRPLYLGAAIFAVLALSAWGVAAFGLLNVPGSGAQWHAHEMLFGFAVAVIVGFLFTAGRNWTGLPTPEGRTLGALVGLWLAGRLAMAFAPGLAAAMVDLVFLPAAAFALGRVLYRANSRRNYFVVVLLAALTVANLLFHLARAGLIDLDPLQPLWFALGLITLLETIIGGRVIPSFTAAALRGVRQWQHTRLNQAAIVLTGLALLFWVFRWGSLTAVLAALAAILQCARCIGWNPWATRRVPLLWSLHLAHAWIPLALALMVIDTLGWAPRSAVVHALGIGATGGLIMAMMTRTARGHLGRPLQAGRLETIAYAAIQFAVLARVLTLLLAPSWTLAGVAIAACLWCLSFGLYVWRYAPWLIRPRADGRPG